LEERSSLVELVRKDLERGLKKPNAGRDGITPTQTLLSLILMRVKNWDYRELRERIDDGYTLRTFTQFDSHPSPSMTPSTGPSTASPRPLWQPSTNW
jgi:IS5 family transposase